MSKIEPVRVDQAEALARLHAKCFSDAWTATSMEELFSGRDARAWGIWDGEEFRAFTLITPCVDDAEVLSVATDPEYRGQGFAHDVLAHGMLETRNAGFDRLLLEVAADNVHAIRLYEGLGFLTDGSRPRYYVRENGPAVDAILMSCKL